MNEDLNLKDEERQHRLAALIAVLIAIAGPWCYDSYLDTVKEDNKNAVILSAQDKLAEANSALVDIIKDSEKVKRCHLKCIKKLGKLGD